MLTVAQARKIFLGEYIGVEPLSGGHIHQTYKVKKVDGKSLIFQRFNTDVFKRKDLVEQNYLRCIKALESTGVFTLPFVLNDKGGIFFEDNWRICEFLENSKTREICSSEKVAFEAGKIAGTFLKAISRESGYPFIIENFHSPSFRYKSLPKSTKETRELFREIELLKNTAFRLEKPPMCITHNDLKLTNILFIGEEAKAIIDLDLIQPGSQEIDFGDLLRSVGTSGAEDEYSEAEMSLVTACIAGFIGTGVQIDHEFLAYSPFVVSWTLGVRFLTDYLSGDRYFKISYPKQNFKRAEAQIARAKMWLEKRESLLKEIKNA